MRFFKLPDLGEGLQEAEIVEWHIQPGDQVAADQLVVSVETAKAIVEVPSPQSGTISHCFGNPGDLVHIGEPLIEFADAESEDTGTVVGEIKSAQVTSTADDFIIGAAPSSLQTAQQTHPQITPALRQMAARLEVKLEQLRGTGPQGQITTQDIEATHQLNHRLGESESLRGTRRTMAKAMTLAHEQVAAVTLCDDADVEHWPQGTDITIRLCKAIAHAATAEPGLNAWFDGQQLSRRLFDNVDIGIAVDTPDGLFVPVLRNVHNRSDSDLRDGLNYLRQDVKKRTIPPQEMQGATITLSNFGTVNKNAPGAQPVMAGRYASPMIVPPMVSIIGAGAIRKEAVVVNDQIVIHRRLPLSLSFDHRCITGGEAARFLAALIAHLQD